MNTNNFRIDSVELGNLLRTFNIDRPDIKELWSTGAFGTIAVPADRYKQYYDAIEIQAQHIATLESALQSIAAYDTWNWKETQLAWKWCKEFIDIAKKTLGETA